MRRRIAVVAALLVVAALVVGGLLWWRSQPSTELARAFSLAPADAQRVTWTDWRGIRDELGRDLDADSSDGDVRDLLSAGFEADLTSTSTLLSSAEALHESFGFSPATLDWELFSQSVAGAVVMMAIPDSIDLGQLAERFEGMGYDQPPEEGGVWIGGPELLPRIAPGLTPELQYLAIDTDRRLVLASDAEPYLGEVVAALGEGDGPDGLDGVVETIESPLSAVVYDSDHVCTELAMSGADDADQAAAETLISQAGEVNPLTGYAMAAQPGGGIRVALGFENADQARTNADTRQTLAGGPAPGQGGAFGDRFAIDQVSADGPVVTMELDPVEGAYVLSDLSSGPVLFATC